MGVLSVVMGVFGVMALGVIFITVVGGVMLENDKAKANAFLAHGGKK